MQLASASSAMMGVTASMASFALSTKDTGASEETAM